MGDNIFGNLHSCCMIRDVMVPWHVVMGKAEYGHNAGNELRRVRHYLSAQEQKNVMRMIALLAGEDL
jgi:hypothetical protein